MQASEASRQIAQMVEFIKQEAREKADEIRVKTDQEFNIACLNHIERAKKEIREQFAQKQKEKLTKSKIARSFLVQEARSQRMQEQENIVQAVKKEALARLEGVSSNPVEYKRLVKALIVQGLTRLREENVVVRCRKADVPTVTEVMDDAVSTYSEIMERDIGVPHVCSLRVDDEVLPPASSEVTNEAALTCAGGIVLLAHKKKILVSNTLDHRLDLCFEELKPTIRSSLFASAN